jgi:hypothetical protein
VIESIVGGGWDGRRQEGRKEAWKVKMGEVRRDGHGKGSP